MLYSLIIIDLKINSEYHLQIEKKIGKMSDLETDTEHEILYHIQTAMLAPSCLLKHILYDYVVPVCKSQDGQCLWFDDCTSGLASTRTS